MPGPLTIRWEETINHNGGGFRIAFSPVDDTQYDNFVLADHIPHHDLASSSKFYDYVINIPNIDCPRCSIQVINPMTDSFQSGTTCCTYPGSPLPSQPPPTTVRCASVYHTCANVRIHGTVPVNQYLHSYNGPCGPYNQNSAAWVLNGSSTNEYFLSNPDYAAGLSNSCPQWKRYCTQGQETPTPTPTPPSPPSPPSPPPSPIDLQALGFTSQATIASGISLFWIPASSGDTQVTYALRASVDAWLGVGWTGGQFQMVGSEAVIGQIINGVPTIMMYNLTGKDNTLVVPAPVPLYNTQAQYISGITTIIFTRDINSGKYPINLNSDYLIGAIGSSPTLAIHAVRSMDMTQVNYISGQATILSNGWYDVHATFMTFSWGILMPVAVIFARYGKSFPNALWFSVHRIAQIVAYVMAVLGFFVALGMVQGSHYKTVWHAQFGTFVLIWGLAQLLVGIFRPHKDEKEGAMESSGARKIFEIAHPWSGRILLFFALIQIFGGMAIRQSPAGWIVLFVFILLIYIGVVAFFEVRKWRNKNEP